ncbi:hypothetical protein [Rhizohabitans arisaemae]|uniref:hypothetical protein n=1 Tax=Rhizohabitans arisaemae TaxID=2720610 RepID=UPI0024B1D834|nr:hypothetical protein [Rhizohabitans arisaemae]
MSRLISLVLLAAVVIGIGIYSVSYIARLEEARETARFDVSEAESIEVLRRAYAAASTGDLRLLCGSSIAADENMCRGFIADANRRGMRLPGPMPKWTGSEEIVSRSGMRNGRVLHLEGETSDGRPYRTDFLVVRSRSGLVTMTPVFWTGNRLASSGR